MIEVNRLYFDIDAVDVHVLDIARQLELPSPQVLQAILEILFDEFFNWFVCVVPVCFVFLTSKESKDQQI